MAFENRPSTIFPVYRLESESSTFSNEDTESVYSIQDKETDLARDTSDTENQSSGIEYELEIEYDVDSLSESDTNSLINCSEESDDDNNIVLAAAAVIADSSFDHWVTDGEDSDMSSSEETSFNRPDYWTCVKCKSQNNNPLFRYCEKCFQDRKTLFPPRPRHKKSKKNKKPESPVKLDTLRSCLNGLSQDSGIGSSQEFPLLGLDKIVVPQHLTENSSITSRSSIEEDEDIIPSSQQPTEEASSSSKQVTLNDIVKNISNRKRQMSESSFSESEVKRPRWRDVKKSPIRESKSPSNGSLSPSRKRKSMSSDREFPDFKRKSSKERHSSANFVSKLDDMSTSVKVSQENIDASGKTSDLGSEISSNSGTFVKAEYPQDSLLESKELCIFCNVTPKNAIFLHGNVAHMCCCYQCAKKTWRTIKRCPICNRRVNNVIRVYKT